MVKRTSLRGGIYRFVKIKSMGAFLLYRKSKLHKVIIKQIINRELTLFFLA